jgi:membrane protein
MSNWFKSVFVRDQWKQLQADLLADSNFDGAASLAYYLTLAIFPGLIFAMTLLPYFSLPDVNGVLSHNLFDYLPTRAAMTVQSTLFEVMKQPHHGLMSLSFLGGLIAASSGLAAIMRQMNIAYDVRETRTLWHTRLVAMLITILLSLVLITALLVIVGGGFFFSGHLISALRWIVALITVYSGISIVYYVGPNMERIGRVFGYFSPGAWFSTILILLSTWLLGVYLNHFDSYNKIYGGLAGIIVLMVWFYLIGLAILMGAQLNHFCLEKAIFWRIAKKSAPLRS